MNDNMTKYEIISELRNIAFLVLERKYARSKFSGDCDIEREKKGYGLINECKEHCESILKEQKNILKPFPRADKIDAIHELPEFSYSGNTRSIVVTWGVLSLLTIITCFLSGISAVFSFLFLPLLCVSLYFLFKIVILVKSYRKCRLANEKREKWKALFEKNFSKEKNDALFNDFKECDKAYLSYLNSCAPIFNEAINNFKDGWQDICEDYKKKMREVAEEYAQNGKQLFQITVIDAELFELAGKIASMLEQGRAESLKEAINLAIDEDRQEKHNQAMQEEAKLQTLAAQEQAKAEQDQAYAAQERARAEREHNEQMQRIAAEHNRNMEIAAQEQARAAQEQARAAQEQSRVAQEQARAAQKQADEAKYNASRRCQFCANFTKCSSYAKQNAVNCASYRPQ